MQSPSAAKAFLPLTIIFIITSGLFITFRTILEEWNINVNVLIIGNAILFFATIFSFFMYSKGLASKNGHAFLRLVYGGMMLKLVVCILSAFIYIFTVRKNVNKAAIFVCMFLYLVYTFVEIAIVMKRSKEKKNA